MEQGSSSKKLWVVVTVLFILIAGAAAATYFFFTPSPNDDIAINLNADFVSLTPTAGTWDLYFAAGTENLWTNTGECPDSGPGGIAWGNGNVGLSVSELGDSAVLHVEGNDVYFSRALNENNNLYTSASMLYATRGGAGIVNFDFGANTPDSIVGTIHWFGDTCNGEYPFTMTLIQASPDFDTEPPVLQSGAWDMVIEDMDDLACDPEMANFTGLPSENVTIEYVTDLDTGQPDPGSIYIYNDAGGFSLDATEQTNVYNQTTDAIDIGDPVDAVGDVLLDFSDDTYIANMNIIATSETTATGAITIQSSSGCSFTVPFTLTAV